jgi:hypothetical protein
MPGAAGGDGGGELRPEDAEHADAERGGVGEGNAARAGELVEVPAAGAAAAD